jgi:putative oxidoreductase
MIDTRTAPYAALLMRISLGTMFIAHALLKILVFTPAGTVGFFASLGVPGWLAYPTMGAELIGGLLLVTGIQTRIVSLALLPVLLGSIVLVHGGNGWLFTNEHGGWEYPLFLVAATLVQALLGDGAYGLSRVLARRGGDAARVPATA